VSLLWLFSYMVYLQATASAGKGTLARFATHCLISKVSTHPPFEKWVEALLNPRGVSTVERLFSRPPLDFKLNEEKFERPRPIAAHRSSPFS
jgi:hypothetical protein